MFKGNLPVLCEASPRPSGASLDTRQLLRRLDLEGVLNQSRQNKQYTLWSVLLHMQETQKVKDGI